MLFDLARDGLKQHNLLADPAAGKMREELERRTYTRLLETQACM